MFLSEVFESYRTFYCKIKNYRYRPDRSSSYGHGSIGKSLGIPPDHHSGPGNDRDTARNDVGKFRTTKQMPARRGGLNEVAALHRWKMPLERSAVGIISNGITKTIIFLLGTGILELIIYRRFFLVVFCAHGLWCLKRSPMKHDHGRLINGYRW